jgi:hypothetical protein
MCTIADQKPALIVYTSLIKISHLLKDRFQMDNNPIPNHIHRRWVEHAARQHMERKLLSPNNDRMAGIGSSIEPTHDVILFSKDVNELSFPLVTPLTSDDGTGLTMNACSAD